MMQVPISAILHSIWGVPHRICSPQYPTVSLVEAFRSSPQALDLFKDVLEMRQSAVGPLVYLSCMGSDYFRADFTGH